MACPLSKTFVEDDTACGCSGNRVAWKHVGCEPDWVDAEGYIHCTPSCSDNKRPLFSCNFICGTDKDKVGKFKASDVIAMILAIRANACAASCG